jgi:anti-sigma B factor antagonist
VRVDVPFDPRGGEAVPDPLASVEARPLVDGRAVVSLAGVVDGALRAELDQALRRALARDPEELVVDLSQAVALDSAALGALVVAGKRVNARGGRIVFTEANRAVARIFEITGLNRVFRVERAG